MNNSHDAEDARIDRLLDFCPADELPAWPPNALLGCLSNVSLDALIEADELGRVGVPAASPLLAVAGTPRRSGGKR